MRTALIKTSHIAPPYVATLSLGWPRPCIQPELHQEAATHALAATSASPHRMHTPNLEPYPCCCLMWGLAQAQEDVKHLKDQRSRLQKSASSAAAKAEVCPTACCTVMVQLLADLAAHGDSTRKLLGLSWCVPAWALPQAAEVVLHQLLLFW